MTEALHVWCGSVAQQLRDAGEPRHWLSRGEQQRFERLHAPGRRNQFIAGRWLLRQALVAVHGRVPRDWSLSAPTNAAPHVEGGPRLGLAHSGDLVACVLAEHAIGIDIECHARRALNVAGLTSMALNEAEHRRVLEAKPGDAQRDALLASWTLKEAWIKSGAAWSSLTGIDTVPQAEGANALVWQSTRYTLALVGVTAGTPVVAAGALAPTQNPQPWRVQLTSA